MFKRRAFLLLILYTSFIMVIAVRLFYLQWTSSFTNAHVAHSIVHHSIAQRMEQLVIDEGRGHFYDRNMQPLTGETYDALAVFPKRLQRFLSANDTKKVEFDILEKLAISQSEWKQWIEKRTVPFLWRNNDGKPYYLSADQIETIESWKMPGLHVVPYVERYRPPYLAAHLIGYIGEDPERLKQMVRTSLANGHIVWNERLGGTGLERSFDPFIVASERTKSAVAYFVDGRYNTVRGLNMRWLPRSSTSQPFKVVTTIDLNIQRAVENIVDRVKMKKGAIVVLDAKHADVVAMVSRPLFDPYRIDPHKDEWNNLAIQAFAPGSIFKTVVAAAALENETIYRNETFYCTGEWGRYGFSCWQRSGHGELTLEQAFAQSCNITFAHLANRLGADRLERIAQQLGIGTTIGWSGDISWNDVKINSFRQLIEEQPGQLFAQQTPKDDEGVLIQTSIGQRDVRMTPLQAANLIVTLLNDGEVKSPRIVREIRDQNNMTVKRFPPLTYVKKNQGVSKQTAREITRWMRTVVTNGTGQRLRTTIWPVAGKTGTAQAGSIGGIPVYHQWFIGYGPVHTPRYAVAVLVHQTDGREGHLATSLFGQIMDELARLHEFTP